MDITYKINNNNDWNTLPNEEVLVDISNDSYFGFRAMEKGSKAIIYNPYIIDSLIRIGKESNKFPNVIHILIFDEETVNYEAKNNEIDFLKSITRKIEELISLNKKIRIDFYIKTKNLDNKKIKTILSEIYNIST